MLIASMKSPVGSLTQHFGNKDFPNIHDHTIRASHGHNSSAAKRESQCHFLYAAIERCYTNQSGALPGV
jgi:hypothetical protein